MQISLDSLISYEKLKRDADSVLDIVDRKGQAVILKDDQPAYIIIKYHNGLDLAEKNKSVKKTEHTLQEAMKIVLMEREDKKLHAAKLADEIYRRGLYYKKNGDKAQYNQIRARANHYPELFDPLPGNIIKLKDTADM